MGCDTEYKTNTKSTETNKKHPLFSLCGNRGCFTLYDLFFLGLVCQAVNEPRDEETQCKAQHKAAQHIGGEVHIQVQPGKGDEIPWPGGEKAMKAASTSAGTPNFRFCSQSAKAAAKAEAVCPEGKECPWGRLTRMVIAVFTSQGRGRANSGLRKKCPAAMYSTSATAMAKPALRVRRKSRSSRVKAIQISP